MVIADIGCSRVSFSINDLALAVTSGYDTATRDTVGATVNSQDAASGTSLYCYECRDNFRKKYDPDDAACLKIQTNISLITKRQCSQRDRYCRVSVCVCVCVCGGGGGGSRVE